ncbi:NADH-ubiquinone oxidoreductase-F iron-sulfur binding region domain-containing protein [Streptomyces sp. ICBB 8177]|uniref:NADH-ubiquinone oxidoreductase-F iron-sulfur binding region domain-containing protein n=1 Tax=Streptomyces sp. ICBB 8177 TaxID=563922 RepID=UPI000D674CAB|nr:NADH-ubiquinone oxidoreductase-F iron-sulfur binding region domain-containing protein [Streptomyces sp. ICBB 8177]PWI42999.1 Fe-S-binding domain-containing protein [Streptomyces sp. ICBB 8177]
MTTIRPLLPAHFATALGSAPGVGEDLEAYLRAGGYRPCDPAELLERITRSGLRGRGGAGFPAALKLATVRDARGEAVVVANGEEGEPGSVKDRWLLRARPHLVLDGLARAAAITGARAGYVYVSDPDAADRVRAALKERGAQSQVRVVLTEPAYVAGEETAVVRRINGGPALPTAKPPRPYERGVDGAPTLVANVETLARIALLAASAEDPGPPGPADAYLLTLSAGDRPAVLTEAVAHTTLDELARLLGTERPRAVLTGGLSGGLLGPGSGLPVERDALASASASLGCGAIRFLGPDECPVAVVADSLAYLSGQSARQCGVCVSGTSALRDTVAGLTAGRVDDERIARLTRWSSTLPGRGACGLLDAAARLVASLLRVFPALVEAHRGRPCAPVKVSGQHRLRVPVPEVSVRLPA